MGGLNMSDYISREAMSETPKCPGCGADMELMHLLCNATFYYACPKCGWGSPIGIDPESAFRMAMRRAEPKNRVLTLEEVKKSNAVWVEGKSGQLTLPPIPVLVYGEATDDCNSNTPCIALVNANADMADYLVDDYNHNWRCWLRKPTKEEMEETPWKS